MYLYHITSWLDDEDVTGFRVCCFLVPLLLSSFHPVMSNDQQREMCGYGNSVK